MSAGDNPSRPVAVVGNNKRIVPLLICATGFIGKVILERLLCTFGEKNVEKVYVLIRSKAGQSSEERFKDLIGSACFDNCRDTLLENEQVVVPIDGDACQVDLGLRANDYSDLISDVTHIINLAASVRFDMSLLDATKMNVESSLNVLNFAKKVEGIKNLVHCSTAYVARAIKEDKNQNIVDLDYPRVVEPVYAPECLPDIFPDRNAVETFNRIMSGEEITKVDEEAMLQSAGLPNTYTFTKCLAEILISEQSKGYVPLTIVRPSMVGASLKYPTPGWIDSTGALAGPLYLVGGGFLHSYYGDTNVKFDVVPCDYVAECLINAACEEQMSLDDTKVIHATSGLQYSLKLGTIGRSAETFFAKRKTTFLKPYLRSTAENTEKSIQKDIQRLQAIRLFLSLTGKKGLATKIKKVIPHIAKIPDQFHHFANTEYDFQQSGGISIKGFAADFEADAYLDLFLQGIYHHLLHRGKTLSPSNPKPKYDQNRNRNDHNKFQIFGFEDITFTVHSKRNEPRTIIQNISHRASAGQMVAILGPSGSGKTTLMNILTLKAHYGRLTGKIMLDDVPLDREKFEKYCFYVQQFDKNWMHLTVNEVLTYTAQLSSTEWLDSDDAITRAIDEVAESMGLSDARHTYSSHLSGGQQRRLSLAVALLNNPSILFLDEITSGLDSAASDNICKVLRRVTQEKNLIAICTIHQPSLKVYERFDEIVLLSKGQVAYAGNRAHAEDYFSSLGCPLPPRTNPAEHYLDLLNSNFGATERLESILDKWGGMGDNWNSDLISDQLDLEEGQRIDINLTSHTSFSSRPDYSIGDKYSHQDQDRRKMFSGFKTVFRRHLLLAWRNPIPYLGRSIAFLTTNSIFAFVYWRAREYSQGQLMNKMWLVMWFVCIPTMMGVAAVVSLHDETSRITGEIRNGMVKPINYLVVKFVLTVPIVAIFAFMALGIPMFVIQNFRRAQMVPVLCQWALVVYQFESVAEFVTVLSNNAINGVLVYLSYWILCLLFAGILITSQSIYWPLKIFYHAMPFSYYARSVMFILFQESTFEACKPETSLLCFVDSTTGSEVLKEFERMMPVLKDPDPWRDALYIAAMIIFFKAFYIMGFIWKVTRCSTPSHRTVNF